MRTALIDWMEFKRSRVTFYSRTAGKRYSGWLMYGEGDEIRILSKDLPTAKPSESFVFQIFGRMHDVLCGAAFEHRQGSDTKIEEADTELLQFRRENPVRVQNTRSELRRSLHGLTGAAWIGSGEPSDVILQDISKKGIAFVATTDPRIGQEGNLTVPSDFGEIQIIYTVKNCKKMTVAGAEISKFRIGATIDPVDRISSINLKRLLDAK